MLRSVVQGSRQVGQKFCPITSSLWNSARRWKSSQTIISSLPITSSQFSYNNSDTPYSKTVTVKAYFIARNIDILKVDTNVYGSSRHAYESKNVTININPELNQHISVFKFGAVVFFNIPEALHFEHLRNIKEIASLHPISGTMHTDEYKVIIHKNLDKPSVIKAEHVNIRNLDSNNITIVATVMAQTVALDYYALEVEKMLQQFIELNRSIQKTGKFQENDAFLYQLIASNNIVVTTVLSKLGIFEGSDAAWDNRDYHFTWESLRKDFELEFRFRDLAMKIDIVKEDTRFFLEMLHNKKTSNMEKMIIVLIAMELLSNIYFHFVPFVSS